MRLLVCIYAPREAGTYIEAEAALKTAPVTVNKLSCIRTLTCAVYRSIIASTVPNREGGSGYSQSDEMRPGFVLGWRLNDTGLLCDFGPANNWKRDGQLIGPFRTRNPYFAKQSGD
jgi:hypothetical protein